MRESKADQKPMPPQFGTSYSMYNYDYVIYIYI